jgi:hypothetical protein
MLNVLGQINIQYNTKKYILEKNWKDLIIGDRNLISTNIRIFTQNNVI